MDAPPLVCRARSQASEHGFPLSCDDGVGRLLAVLAAAVPRNGSVLELGTGAGVGLAWLSHGLDDRSDVDLQSVEADAALADLARSLPWPQNVTVHHGDALQVLRRGAQVSRPRRRRRRVARAGHPGRTNSSLRA